MESIRKHALRGAVWTLGGYFLNQVLRLASNLILTRLLVPEYFGIMAIANTIRIGLELFSDLGIGQSIIQNKNGEDPDFRNTAWTVQILRGMALWGISLIATWPLAKFYGDDRPEYFTILLWLIPLVSLTSLIDGFRSTAVPVLKRRMQLGKLTMFELFAQVVFLVVLVVWCYFSPSVFALAAGGLFGSTFQTVGTFFLMRDHRHRLAWNPVVMREILKFGQWMFVATALMFAAGQADRLILGKLLTFGELGVYTIAYTMSDFPRAIFRMLGDRVLFPVVAQRSDLPRSELRLKLLLQRRKLLLGGIALLTFLTVAGDWIIYFLYDNRYEAATWMMPILCAGIWFSLLYQTTGPALLGLGKPVYAAQSNLARLITVAALLPVGFYFYGILGAIGAIAIADLPSYCILTFGLRHEGLGLISQDLKATLLFCVVLSLAIAARYGLGLGLPIDALFTAAVP